MVEERAGTSGTKLLSTIILFQENESSRLRSRHLGLEYPASSLFSCPLAIISGTHFLHLSWTLLLVVQRLPPDSGAGVGSIIG